MEKNILFINRINKHPGFLETLKKEGYLTDVVYSPEDALSKAEKQDYETIVLQDNPLTESQVLCRDIRRITDAPLIVISNHASAEASVETLNAGADFFLRKPFGALELVARIRCLAYRNVSRSNVPVHQPALTG